MQKVETEYACKNEFFVRTPVGLIRVWSNTSAREEIEHPVICVELVNCEGNISMVKVEYDPSAEGIFTRVFGDMYEDEPTQNVFHKGLELLWDGE